MKNLSTIFILLNLTLSLAFGQNPQLKKKVEIVMTYDYDYLEDGEFYLSKKPLIKTDTIITEFNQDGSLKYPNPNMTWGKPIYIDSTVLISKNSDYKHEREYWSDSTSVNIYTQNFRDSSVQTKVFRKDTIQINKSYFKKGKLIKSDNRDLRPSYSKSKEIILYDVKTRNREVATVITMSYLNGPIDTVKIDYNKKRRVYKTLVYNHDKNEWFVKEKIKSGNKKKIIWDTFYHDYHKMYFTTKTTINLDENGLPESKSVYNINLNHIEEKTMYYYEYY